MNVKGTVFKYGDNVDTDVIIPARYLTHRIRGRWRLIAWRTSTRSL